MAQRAAECAQELIRQLGITEPPVMPLEIVESEGRQLTAIGDNFRNRFDGQLEYHPKQGRFLLFYNTKYDQDERVHPRTRFSISHELGHYFLDEHHAFLRRGGATHKSRGEFQANFDMEREADAFAAALLMPSTMLRPRVNECELSIARVREIADLFQTSLVSTAIRSVQCSDFATAVVGLREGQVAWRFQSPRLIEMGYYPGERGQVSSAAAGAAWKQFASAESVAESGTAYAKDWFRTYSKDHLDQCSVTEEYLPVRSMRTLIVLLSIPEDEYYNDD